MTDEAFRWVTPASKRDRELGVEPGGCTGSPDCAGAVQIREKDGGRWLEVHLNETEIRWLRKQLKRSLRLYRGNRADQAGSAATADDSSLPRSVFDLPELRDFPLFIATSNGIRCGCDGPCPVKDPYIRAGQTTVRDLLVQIAAHRRQWHLIMEEPT